MSEYTFRIWFSGLCHFVPNRDLGARCQLCVVLPKATDGECQHLGRIHTVARHLECGEVRIRPGERLEELNYTRITFDIKRVDDLSPNFPSAPVFPAGVINLEEIAGPFVDENDNIVGLTPDPDNVLAQVLFENGYSTGRDSASVVREWHLPGTLTGISTTFEIFDPVYIEYSGVRSVEVITSSLPGGRETSRSRLRPNGSTIEILVSNRCYDESKETPRGLTLDDVELRLNSNGFEIVQIDRDFAFNYHMLHPATLASLGKFLPMDSTTGDPRYPVPESSLLSVTTGLPFCLDDVLAKLEKLLNETPNGKTVFESLDQAGRKSLKLNLLDLVPTGTGTGSGSDCLGASGLIRFVNLDGALPAPGPATVATSTSTAANRSIRPGELMSSRLGDPPQIMRNQASSVPADLRSRATSPNEPQVEPKPRKNDH